MKKKLVSLMLVAAMAATMVTGCGSNNGNKDASDNNGSTTEESKDDSQEESKDDSQAASGDGAVYYLNFKPEQADQWKALAETYTEQTGVPVTVETAASGTYESTLKSEMAKEEAPTLFQVNGPVGLASWADYCYDLKDSALYKNLKSDDFALIADSGEVQGIAYVIETYGLIYNKKLLADYCAMDGAKIKDASEINSFAKLKEVADDIQAKKDDLGINGAFTSAGMDSSSAAFCLSCAERETCITNVFGSSSACAIYCMVVVSSGSSSPKTASSSSVAL